MTHSLSLLLQVADPQLPPSPGMFILFGLIKAVVAFGIYMLCVAYTTLLERRLAGFIQDRIGPNRVGPQGLLQPIADGLKNFMKEETLPGSTIESDFRTMGSEDMAYMMEKVPGCYFFVGSANPAKGLDAAHHHPRFDIDEDALPRAAALMAMATVRLLGG